MRGRGQQQVIKHAGIGQVAECHADPRQDGDDTQDLHRDEYGYEIGGVTKVGQGLTNPVRPDQVHDCGSEIEQGQQRRADPICVISCHEISLSELKCVGMQEGCRLI